MKAKIGQSIAYRILRVKANAPADELLRFLLNAHDGVLNALVQSGMRFQFDSLLVRDRRTHDAFRFDIPGVARQSNGSLPAALSVEAFCGNVKVSHRSSGIDWQIVRRCLLQADHISSVVLSASLQKRHSSPSSSPNP